METLLDKFIQFGCWNNLNTKKGKPIGCLKNVTTLLNDYLSSEVKKPNFLVVSGDNYYPDKQKDPTDETKKQKFIFQDKLREGFASLPDELPIHMILGNHDLETTTKKPNLFVETLEQPEQRDCKILQLEFQYKKENVDYNFFKDIMLANGTLLSMIDTSIYDVDSKNYLPCYNIFFQQDTIADRGIQFENIEQLREYQFGKIMEAITKHSSETEIKHIIIVGHHPIFQLKNKEEEGIQFTSDINVFFTPVLKSIYERLPPHVKYYYLCSDLHLFQTGIIKLQINSDTTMDIQQYIVGNGGTKLDPPLPPDYKETKKEAENIVYILEEERAQCGFLECVIDESGPNFRPILLPPTSSGGKTKKMKRSKMKRSKMKKSKMKRSKMKRSKMKRSKMKRSKMKRSKMKRSKTKK